MSILMREYDYETDIRVKQQDAYEDGISVGLEQGAYQKALETAKRLIDRGYTTEEIADLVDLPILQVQELSGQRL